MRKSHTDLENALAIYDCPGDSDHSVTRLVFVLKIQRAVADMACVSATMSIVGEILGRIHHLLEVLRSL